MCNVVGMWGCDGLDQEAAAANDDEDQIQSHRVPWKRHRQASTRQQARDSKQEERASCLAAKMRAMNDLEILVHLVRTINLTSAPRIVMDIMEIEP